MLAGVLKVGGSLLDWPDLPRWLKPFFTTNSDRRWVVIVGGGPAADWVRELDQIHQLSETLAHWLALDSLDLTAQAFKAMTHQSGLRWNWTTSLKQLQQIWLNPQNPGIPLMSARSFCEEDEQTCPKLALPHNWSVTSDSIAARLAVRLGADLWLLKSVQVPDRTTRQEAANLGWVDPMFPKAAQGIRDVWLVQARSWEQRWVKLTEAQFGHERLDQT